MSIPIRTLYSFTMKTSSLDKLNKWTSPALADNYPYLLKPFFLYYCIVDFLKAAIRGLHPVLRKVRMR